MKTVRDRILASLATDGPATMRDLAYRIEASESYVAEVLAGLTNVTKTVTYTRLPPVRGGGRPAHLYQIAETT